MNIFPEKMVQLFNGYTGNSPWDGQPFVRNPIGEPIPASMFEYHPTKPSKPQTEYHIGNVYSNGKANKPLLHKIVVDEHRKVIDESLYHGGVPDELQLRLDKESMGKGNSGSYMQKWLIEIIRAAEDNSKQKKEFKHTLSLVKGMLDSHWSSAYLPDAYQEYVRVVNSTFVPTSPEILADVDKSSVNRTEVPEHSGANGNGATLEGILNGVPVASR